MSHGGEKIEDVDDHEHDDSHFIQSERTLGSTQVFGKKEKHDLKLAGEDSEETEPSSLESDQSSAGNNIGKEVDKLVCFPDLPLAGEDSEPTSLESEGISTGHNIGMEVNLQDRKDESSNSPENSAEPTDPVSDLATHEGLLTVECAHCDYKCKDQLSLRIHSFKTHKGEERVFRCKFCSYTNSRASVLKLHLRKHTGEKPFNCEFCEYCCTRSCDLKRHHRIHTGEKPFGCEFCDYRSIDSTHLKRHIRTHTGEKPFSCQFCDYRSTQLSNVKVHLKTHRGEKSTT